MTWTLNAQVVGEDVLTEAAEIAAVFDPDLSATLRDMAAEYAGPWVDPDPQVSDEEWAEAQEEFA